MTASHRRALTRWLYNSVSHLRAAAIRDMLGIAGLPKEEVRQFETANCGYNTLCFGQYNNISMVRRSLCPSLFPQTFMRFILP
jgi:hypothetical protein